MTPALPEAFLTAPIAHRALHDVASGRPENSRAAIQAACKAGYGIEIDLQCSADFEAMVFHDYDLARLADATGDVRSRSAVELQRIVLRGGSEGIPTLAEVLDLVQGQVPLLIEIKDQDGAMGPNVGALETRVAQVLCGYSGDVAVMSFNPHSVQHLSALLPDVPRGLVTSAYEVEKAHLPRAVCDRLRGIPDYGAAKCSFISHEWSDLNRQRVLDLKSAGARILCWTVKSPQDEARARRIAENVTFEQYLAPIPA